MRLAGSQLIIYTALSINFHGFTMAGHVGEVSDNSFEKEVISADIPTIVDFWAPWCPPCKSLAPILDDVASEYAGKVKILKMNVDDNPRTPSKYNVRGIPNLLFFKGGQVVEQIVGFMPKDQLVTAIKDKFAV